MISPVHAKYRIEPDGVVKLQLGLLDITTRANDDSPSPHRPITIETTQGAVISPGAAFKVEVHPRSPGKTRVLIASGMAKLSNDQGEVSRKAGNELTATAGEASAKSP